MTLGLAVQIGTLLSVVFAGTSLLFAVRVYRRQMNAQLFVEYTARYEAIMSSFPGDDRFARLDTDGEAPDESEELTYAVLRYLNLCSEEFYLRKRGYLSNDIWSIWEGEMERVVRSPLLQREWPKIRNEFSTYSEFAAYVDEIQRSHC